MNKRLELYAVADRKVSDAFDRIAVKLYLQKEKKGSKSYLFCGVNPRAGATTLAMNVAINLAAAGWKTILLDFDLRKSVKLKKINDDVDLGIANYLANEVTLEDVIYKTNRANMYCIPCGKNVERPVQMICSPKMRELLDELNKEFDFVIIDVPSIESAVDASIIATHVEETILVAAQARTQKAKIQKCRDEFVGAGAHILGIIMNRVDEMEYKKYMQDYDYFSREKYVQSAQKRKLKKKGN